MALLVLDDVASSARQAQAHFFSKDAFDGCAAPLEVPKGQAAVRRERLEVLIAGCERPQHARLAGARAAAADD